MRLSEPEVLRLTPHFPNLAEGGNLIFSVYANQDKFKSILQNGIRPRGGIPTAGSFFPDAVSLGAVGPEGRAWNLRQSIDAITPTLMLSVFLSLQTKPPYFKFAFVIDQSWIKDNIDSFRGVGDHLKMKELKDVLRVNALANLPIAKVPYNTSQAHANEVHYVDGVLPTNALVGIVNNGDGVEAWRANALALDTIRQVREDKMGPYLPLALYDRTGEIYDVA